MLFKVVTDLKEWDKDVFLVDGVELRLDHFPKIDFIALQHVLEKSPVPILFTLRKQAQGGHYNEEESARLLLIEKLCALKPDFFDIEHDVDRGFLQRMHKLHSDVKIIISYHNFTKTPENLEKILCEMECEEAYAYKIATWAHSTLDALRMLLFVKSQSSKLTGLCMGEKGSITRILGPLVGNFIDYTSSDEVLNLGHVSLDESLGLYQYRKLNSFTSLYALIGSPVEHSIGHITHNAALKENTLNGVYVKMEINREELPAFFSYARHLNFSGFSVTMPLKEEVVPYLDEITEEAKKIGAVNTILSKKGKLLGFNTDGIGAIEAIEEKTSIKNKRIVIVGTGGTAKAIAYACQLRGGNLIFLGRNEARAKKCGEVFQVKGESLDKMSQVHADGYDILINATPHPLPIDPQYILPTALVMEVSMVSHESSLLSAAHHKVYGREMFFNQARLQQAIWFIRHHVYSIGSSRPS